MYFPLGSPPGKDRKILVLSQLPYFFFTLLGTKALQSMQGTLLIECECIWFESYVSPVHTHAPMERGTLGSRRQPAQDHHGVLSLQASQLCLTQCDLCLHCFHLYSGQLILVLDYVLAQHLTSKGNVSWRQRIKEFTLMFHILQLYSELEHHGATESSVAPWYTLRQVVPPVFQY